MDATMFQLRLFVHQRLYAAVEEILGQVEKTITLVLHEADVRAKEEADSLRYQLKSAEELPATSALQHGDECDSPLLQENQGPTNTEESDFTPSPENPGTPEPTADLSSNSGNYRLVERPEVKTEQEEHGEHEYESFFSPPEIVKSEEEQLDTLSSNSSTAVSEETERGEQAITVKRKEKMMQGKRISDGKKAQAALSNKNCSVKGKKGRRFCHLCGKCFHYTASLMKHIKTHEKCTSCIICGTKYRCPKDLVFHLKKKHREAYFCDVCGKTFFNSRSLQTHERTHAETKEFVCQECGKTYRYKHCLISHVRSHSGEKPYPCDICGKRFSQNSNMNRHKTTHMGEKP